MNNQNTDTKNHRKPIPDDVMCAIQKMFLCNDFDEEFACFLQNYNDLKECGFFIYSDDVGAEFPECFKTNYDKEFAVIEIGFSNKYYAIDSQICEEMIKTGEAKYNLDICVELDTQVISYLKNVFITTEKVFIPKEKKDLFYYLSELNVNYSSLPYMIENAKKIDKDNFQEVYSNLLSYEIFRNLDYRSYIDCGEKKYRIDEANMMINVDNMYNHVKSNEFQDFMKDFYDIQENMYCLLLKAVLIENGNSKKSVENKMRMLVEFVNEELGVFCEREMTICYYYFQHNEKTEKFFRKTKPNSKGIKNAVNGMAWDLAHVRLLERLYDFTFFGPVKFGIHPILTYDNGLKDVLKLSPVRKIAIYDGYVLAWLKTPFMDLFPMSKQLIFDKNNTEKRKLVFLNRDIECIRKKLEEELDI